ncbi:MAG: 50S ribosomal protein L18 [Gammaproteobacteria bacterium]|nr:50S ribosomal protein L18 [Gammaproteobacteria bacterium]
MINKRTARQRRAKPLRAISKRLLKTRLSVHRTPQHIYAQIILPDGKVVTAASTVEKELRAQCKNGGNVEAAKLIGKAVAERALKANVKTVAFDRSGFAYHGRIKALADAAREAGLEF